MISIQLELGAVVDDWAGADYRGVCWAWAWRWGVMGWVRSLMGRVWLLGCSPVEAAGQETAGKGAEFVLGRVGAWAGT